MNATPKPKNPSFNDSFILYDYFDMHKFYRKGWTISNKMSSPSKWTSGPYYFSNYMNGDFKSRQLNNTESMNNLLVYVANTTQSVVSQIMGVCDSLLLALFNERQFQCISLVAFTHSPRSRSRCPFVRYCIPEYDLSRGNQRSCMFPVCSSLDV